MTYLRKSCCPTCGQSIKGIRFGVFFTPTKLRILETIQKSPRLPVEQLARRVYPGVRLEASRFTVRSHINQINDLLSETDLVIRGPRSTGNGYILERRNEQNLRSSVR